MSVSRFNYISPFVSLESKQCSPNAKSYFQTYLLIGFTVVAWVYCMLWIESAGDIYINQKNHTHFRKDALLIVRERITLPCLIDPSNPCDIVLIIGIYLGDKMVQSVSVFRPVRILLGLPAHGRRWCRRTLVLHEVRRVVIEIRN